MAVILTNIDMPKSCVECDKRKFNKCYMNSVMVIEHEYRNNDKKIHPDCPLKSVDKLIEAIERLPTQENSEGQDMYQAYDVLRTIREYCGMEDLVNESGF